MSGPGFSFSMDGQDRAIEALDLIKARTGERILMKLQKAAHATLDASQEEVPVKEGTLKATGTVNPGVEGDREHIYFDVTYGDGSATEKTYSYAATEVGNEYDADGYAAFVELGHMSRAGNPVPSQPYLGPAFEEQSQKLLDTLGDILS